MPISNKKEEIDIRILRLIGLEDVFDLDYETYLTLLKEEMVKSRMTKKTIPTEEVMLLTDEYKRVKSKKDNGRFEVKKKKITAGSFSVGSIKGKIAGATATKSLPGISIGASPLSKSLEDNISAITSSVSSIAETLKQQKKISDDASAYGKRKGEQEKRGLRESNLEKRFEGLKKAAEKIIAPVKSLLDKIIQFFTTVILGRIVYKLVEWFGDPKNESKVKSIIRFVKDWWPALLGSYILFGTSFGKLVRGLTGTVGRFIFQLGKVAIPRLLSIIAKNPLASLIVGSSVAGTLARTGEREKLKPELEKQRASVEKTEKDTNAPWYQKLGASFAKQELTTGQQRQSLVAPVPGAMFSGGGLASGYVSGEKGVDKVPAMLSDGEFVMSRGAVAKYGVDTLEAMNAAGGGTNKPKIVSGTAYAAGGGLIGKGEYYINEILKGLAPQYKWAERLARESGAAAQNLASNSYQFAMEQGDKSQRYLMKGGLQNDVTKMMQAGTQYGSTLYDQALKVGNQALSDIQSGKIQKNASNALSQASQLPKKAGVGFFDAMKNISSSKTYQEGSKKIEGVQDKMITLGDNFIKKLPDGPFKEMADKGLIPIPSGNATMMRNLTFVKALMGPLGKPFKILSNKEVDEMRRQTIEKTMGKSGLIVDPKTGEVKMNWNQEDINKGARGGGAYTDKLGPRGSSFNSILGRFSASTEGKGNTLYSDDRYNFNKTVAEYADLAKKGLVKGSISDATYYGASMLGRFAQDVGWLNQRALGSRIEIGKIDRNRLDPKTGKMKSMQQMMQDGKRNEEKKLGGGSVKLYDKPQKNTGESYKSRFARPKNAGVKPVKPPSKPSVIYKYPQSTKNKPSSVYNRPSTSKPPKFSATNNSKPKINILGIRI